MTRGFTLIELLVVISIIAMLAAGAYAGFGAIMPRIRASSAMGKAQAIFKMMSAYATDKGGEFPTTDSSSAQGNLKELFKSGYFDGGGEAQFTIDADPWTKRKLADGDVGKAPDFTQALEADECSWSYVKGLTSSSDGSLPLLANAGLPGQHGIYTKDQGQKGGVLAGTKAVVTFVGGASESIELVAGEYIAKKKKGGELLNVLSSEFETNVDNICEPEVSAGATTTTAN